METEKVVSEMEELPKTIVRRVVKDKLHECSPDADINVHKDSLLAFSESARIFIHYLSATANDICKESKRQTINADDVLKALEEIDFSEFIGPLRASLDEFKQKNAGKRAGASKLKEEKKKQKVEDEQSKSKEGEKKQKVEDGQSKSKDEKKKQKVEDEQSKSKEGEKKQKVEDGQSKSKDEKKKQKVEDGTPKKSAGKTKQKKGNED